MRTGLEQRDPHLGRPRAERAGWQDLDVRAVDTVRLLAADAVQKAGNGPSGDSHEPGPIHSQFRRSSA
jgi:transketolase